ncbi:HU family DNA-binding protein [Plasticicumulans sp.]|uniref:HU family DNA-binding protein n=1 Tax=Plasticicumulans sp. TaxID=2307179 RepID=UPI002CFA74D6|nr:HU family DNA-binding protein [Plasticicumulans sp.]HMV39288.1 HU family DNA-binding protein [Plasticicumulans sp.]HMW29139.1 HU family DNA-binding protein [Plasticicumulans sp.]HMZ09983.1 HU family DNA-binding protein [Plasticicumulans sp.]HNB90516.1 HU family DNA-binding protein [Plasticicumulans sp.]HND97060.1 HU family DNA-binding protein [Plasticicumulans sp.]
MNKSELIDAVADATGITKSDAGRSVEAVLGAITSALQGGDQVTLVGFGTFSVRERAARTGRDPRSGQAIEIKASKNPVFKAGKALKDALK